MSWDVIIPFLKPIEHLILDPEISDILVNGPRSVFVERLGRLQKVPDATVSEKSLQIAVRHIARSLGDDINEEQPLLDARLPDGSRVAAVMPPCSPNGTTLAIRKFQSNIYTAEALVRTGALTSQLLLQLRTAVECGSNILIAGRTGSGKTTLLNALATFFPAEDRVIVIEDTCEIQMEKEHLVRLEARRAQPKRPPVSIRDLLRQTLRLRPDRIVLGEVRGGEAFDLLQAFSTGHSGGLSTIHANCAEHALSRFATCVLQSDIQLPYKVIRRNIGEALDLVVHLDRIDGKRAVTEVLRIKRYDHAEDTYEFETIYQRKLIPTSRGGPKRTDFVS